MKEVWESIGHWIQIRAFQLISFVGDRIVWNFGCFLSFGADIITSCLNK